VSVSVRVLGAGDAFNSAVRCHASYLVRAPSTCFLLDCGPTVLLALRRDGIASLDLDAVVLSHLHGDHFAGLPFLFVAWIHQTPRTRPFTVVGPPGTEERVRALFAAMYKDSASRPLPFDCGFVEVSPDGGFRLGSAELTAFRVPHQRTDISLGWRCEIDGRTIVYSGDTGWTDDLVERSRGADLFLCECCYFETRVESHLDYPRLRENLARFDCRRMMLVHTGEEVHTRRGEVEVPIAYDGLVIEL
jgi:ribonuclease BN (tRNA processing enzyme)